MVGYTNDIPYFLLFLRRTAVTGEKRKLLEEIPIEEGPKVFVPSLILAFLFFLFGLQVVFYSNFGIREISVFVLGILSGFPSFFLLSRAASLFRLFLLFVFFILGLTGKVDFFLFSYGFLSGHLFFTFLALKGARKFVVKSSRGHYFFVLEETEDSNFHLKSLETLN